MDLPANQYRIVYLDFERLKLKLSTLNASQRERLWKTFATDIEQFGPRLIQTKKATRINSDLIEYRYRAHPDVLVRLFFTFRETELVIVLAGYDKLRDPHLKRQRYEIEAANNLLAALDSNYGMY